MEVTLLYNKSNQFGLRRDVAVLREALESLEGSVSKIREADPLEPPSPCDVAIHLEVPIYGMIPWAAVNILMINPEWFECDAWSPYLSHFDGVIIRDTESAEMFKKSYFNDSTPSTLNVWTVPWATTALPRTASKVSMDTADGFVWFLAGSKNKRAAAEAILPLWKSDYPPVKVYATAALPLTNLPPNVTVEVKDLSVEKHAELAAFYPGHIVISKAEGFGYTAAEAERNGAFIVMNNLPAYECGFPYAVMGKGVVQTDLSQNGIAKVADFTTLDQTSLDVAIRYFLESNMTEIRKVQKLGAEIRHENFLEQFERLWRDVKEIHRRNPKVTTKNTPPVLLSEDCPPISIVTLLYNRRKFFDLACHNIMLSDYPKDKIEWLIVEDSDDPNENASDRVIQVGLKAAPLTVAYVPLDRKTPISEKRNLGVKRAKNDIILFMDDDDHYPVTSFRRRVAWLTLHQSKVKQQAAVCTTIACYDLIRGVSAVNTPPWNLPLRKRVSEATLTFYRSWWVAKKFTFGVNISEGEGFLEGREHEVLEMPPQQIIVAFNHKKNISGRRIPADDAKPGCFWGFPKEFLVYIHKLAGIEVESSS